MSLKDIPKRYYLTLLLFLSSLLEGYVMTVMSVVIVDTNSERKITRDNRTEIIKAEFNWTSTEKALLLGINSFGQIFACISGAVVHKIGGATFLGVGTLGEALISLTTPLTMSIHVYLTIANRFALGLFEGVSFVGWADVFVHWAPPNERVRLFTYASLGFGIGAAINYPLSGFIVENFGWRSLFYIFGAVSSIWSIVWMVFVSNDPSADKFISEKERNYLSRELNYAPKEQIAVPYKKIFTSVPVYVLLNEFLISSLTASFIILLPLYIKDVYDANIQIVGLISGIPEISSLITRPLFATFADYLRSKPDARSVGRMHNSFLFWGQSFTAVFFLISATWNNLVVCIVCFTLARIAFNLCQVSYNVIVNDMAGPYAGFLQSIVVAVKSLAYFVNPLIIGSIITDHRKSEWSTYFQVMSCLMVYKVIVFQFFGSGDPQPWSEVPSKNAANKETAEEGIALCEISHQN